MRNSKALEKLYPFQKADFIGIFKEMNGMPVTIRTIDPPLHEFLPHNEPEQRVLAEKLGAENILAIDNDELASINANENVIKNNCKKIKVLQGDASTLSQTFDIIIANINRNIILNDLPLYVKYLNANGEILLRVFMKMICR